MHEYVIWCNMLHQLDVTGFCCGLKMILKNYRSQPPRRGLFISQQFFTLRPPKVKSIRSPFRWFFLVVQKIKVLYLISEKWRKHLLIFIDFLSIDILCSLVWFNVTLSIKLQSLMLLLSYLINYSTPKRAIFMKSSLV